MGLIDGWVPLDNGLNVPDLSVYGLKYARTLVIQLLAPILSLCSLELRILAP